MQRLELHLKGSYVALLIALGIMSCGFTPFVMWLVAIRNYPKAFDAEGVTLRSGERVPWKALTERRKLIFQKSGRRSVVGLGLVFGKIKVKVAPRVFVEEPQVLPFISRIVGEDLTKP